MVLPDFAVPGVPGRVLPADRADSFYMLSAALTVGLKATVFPDEVLLVSQSRAEDVGVGDPQDRVAFVRGVPPSSTLSGVSYSQERRIRKVLLQRGGMPLPTGSSFTIRKGFRSARSYAAKLGFPVSVKAARGAATTEVFDNLQDDSEVRAALRHFEKAPLNRPEYVRAVIAPPDLSVKQIDGKDVIPLSQRVVVERHKPGIYLRCLVIEGEFHTAVACEDGPWSDDPRTFSDVTTQLHPTLRDLSLRAVDLIPGIETAAVDFRVESVHHSESEQRVYVVEVGEEPLLYVQHMLGNGVAQEAAVRLLESHAPDITSVEREVERPSLSLWTSGVSDVVDFEAGIREVLGEHDGEMTTEESDRLNGTLSATVQGSLPLLAYLGSTALYKGVGAGSARCTMMTLERSRRPRR